MSIPEDAEVTWSVEKRGLRYDWQVVYNGTVAGEGRTWSGAKAWKQTLVVCQVVEAAVGTAAAVRTSIVMTS